VLTAEKFRALGDPVRLRLFRLLAGCDELCVCHLTAALKLPQSTISRHLGILRNAGLAETRRDGKWMFYRLADGMDETLFRIAKERPEGIQRDEQRLEQTLNGCV